MRERISVEFNGNYLTNLTQNFKCEVNIAVIELSK